ncbi:MAG: hypothetical protein DBX66_08995 [Clostridiales bacterium]|uniref:hypothetical protein n=1 Tax=Provencibacterium massiliense TaxID=1841868 RepID=UPI0009A6A824|nr:hypothetical protein [Provencibacterium massiliense]PWM35014.1 MAG: hypothetical protein DBX66_08995 [Clostridiales bacterium]RGB68666.1 hypothetical protein DW086_02745 [Harryflintia acetispora]
MKRLLFALLACCVLALPCRAEAAGPSPGLLVPVIPDARTGHYQITVSDAEALTAASVTRSVERTGITAKTDVFVEYPLDVEHPQTYYVTVSALPEADRIGLDAPASKTFPVTTGCCPGVEGAFILGDGSAADPYQVYTPAQLRHVQQHLDAQFAQKRDITLTGTWTPLGTLTGVYDGGGYSIGGLNSTTGGLFASLSGATVKNMRLTSPTVGGMYYVGGIANVMTGATVADCSVTGDNVSGSGSDVLSTGGIGGLVINTRFERCTVTGTIGGTAQVQLHQGGIAGHNTSSVYIGCLSSVQFSGSAVYAIYTGGVSGATENNASPITLQNCHWTNPVHAVGRAAEYGGNFTPNTGDSFGNSQVPSIDGLS